MGNRYLLNASTQMLGTDQDHNQSHVTAQRSHIHMGRYAAPGNDPMFHPMENRPTGRAFCASQRGLEYRPVAHTLPSVTLESPPLLQGTLMGPAFDPFLQFPVVGSSYHAPANNSAHAHTSYYASHSMHEVSGIVDPTTGTRRGSFKRKSPSISVPSERGRSTFYGAGSSCSSSELQVEKSTYQTSEESRRNVRSRSGLDLEPPPRPTYLSNYFPHYSQTTNLTNQSGAAGVTNFSAVTTTQEHNHAILVPATHGNNGLNQEMNWFPIGSGTAENGGHFHDSISRRNVVVPPHRQNAPAHAARDMNCSYSRRAMPSYRAGLSSSSLRHETVPSQNGPPYRHTRLPSARGYWDERSRMHIQRFEPLSDDVYTRDGLGSEDFMMVNHSSLYGSSNLFDQYMDMTIDVDSMSYEELLALEERIGNVNTGLSGDMISKCLETTQSSSDHNLNENCAICLEEYKRKEEVGRIKNCGHRYHVGCITKWLSMKNACPICKAPALSDSSKEQWIR